MKLLAENFNTKVYQKQDGLLIIHAGKDTDTKETLVSNLTGIWPKTGVYLLPRVREREGSFNSMWTGFIPKWNVPHLE